MQMWPLLGNFLLHVKYMKNLFAIVVRETLEIKNVYWSEDGNPESARVDETTIQVPVPEDLDYFCIKALPDFTIVVDEVKIQEKKQKNLEDVRTKRNQLLTASDWTQFRDSPLTTEQQDAWALYRQALRDLPSSTADPTQVVWPTPPS